MGRTVIMVKSVLTGFRRVFQTLEEAGEALGLTASALSSACADGRSTREGWLVRRVERVYLLRLRYHQLWIPAVRNSRGVFVEFGNPSRRFQGSEIGEVRDVTVGWYMQDGDGGEA